VCLDEEFDSNEQPIHTNFLSILEEHREKFASGFKEVFSIENVQCLRMTLWSLRNVFLDIVIAILHWYVMMQILEKYLERCLKCDDVSPQYEGDQEAI